eukprot:gene539-7873_t
MEKRSQRCVPETKFLCGTSAAAPTSDSPTCLLKPRRETTSVLTRYNQATSTSIPNTFITHLVNDIRADLPKILRSAKFETNEEEQEQEQEQVMPCSVCVGSLDSFSTRS